MLYMAKSYLCCFSTERASCLYRKGKLLNTEKASCLSVRYIKVAGNPHVTYREKVRSNKSYSFYATSDSS